MALREVLSKVKTLAGKPKYNELYTLGLVSIGLPSVIYLWFDWKAALTSFIIIQTVLGITSLRSAE